MIGISAIKTFITGNKVPIADLPDINGLEGAELEYYNTVGIKTIYDAPDHSSYQLAEKACQQLLEENGIGPDEINFIIFIRSRVPDHFISSEATRLKEGIQAKKAQAFSISDLGCTDSTMALQLARDLLLANRTANHVLITYGSKQYASTRYRYPVTITGDGGVACLVSRTEQNMIQDIRIESHGKYWDLFKMEFKQKTSDAYVEECSDMRKYGFELALESRNVFMEINQGILQKHGLEKTDIAHYMMQNISARAYDYYEQAFEIKLSPICKMNLGQYGHLGAGDILVNYATGLASGFFQSGTHVMMMNNSPVAAWSSVLFKV